MRSATVRAATALAAVSLWLALLVTGHPLAGASHLLLPAALAVFPWTACRGSHEPSEHDAAEAGSHAVAAGDRGEGPA